MRTILQDGRCDRKGNNILDIAMKLRLLYLPASVHLPLTFFAALVLAGCAAWATVFFELHPIFLVASIPCCFIGVVWLFRNVIPAKCPRCGGGTYLQRGEIYDTFKYRCKSCGHVHDTGVLDEPMD